jgi:dienelactone hydrolase
VFERGETQKTFSVPILERKEGGPDKKFKLVLSHPSSGVSLGSNQTATVTILDATGMKSHHFDRVDLLPDGEVTLTLSGGVSKRFQPYFDLYPLEISAELVTWTPFVTVQRTNTVTNPSVAIDRVLGERHMRFYRTPTNHWLTPLMSPTGGYAVGTISRMLTDPSRRNRYGVSTNGSFMIRLWYPAIPEPGKFPNRLVDPPLARDPAWGPLIDRAPYFVSHCLRDAHSLTNGAPYPLILYSHGSGGNKEEVLEKAEDLASHGYIVVSMDHWDAFASVFPDGTVLRGPPGVSELPNTAAGFEDRVRDLIFVLDQLAQWNDIDPAFAGRIDMTKVAAMGFSFGGEVAGEFGRTDERCKAVVSLEGYFAEANTLLSTGLEKPYLSFTVRNGDSRLFARAVTNALWLEIGSSVHVNYQDFYWANLPADVPGGREIAHTVNAFILWFFDHYLKGSSAPLPMLADFPRITNPRQK